MRERPILFSAPMVRALLAGTKWQTRRVVKPQPPEDRMHTSVDTPDKFVCPGEHTWWAGNHTQGIYHSARCPYGQPGDRLIVRETFYAWGHWETRFSAKKGRDEWHFVDMTMDGPGRYFYAADGAHPASDRRASSVMGWWKRPAIFMPKAASRMLLEVTDVRVERLNDISEADAAAEGLTFSEQARRSRTCMGIYECRMPDGKVHFNDNAVELYRTLWGQINGAGSWDVNPWVWAVSFRVIKGGQP